ncbi:uncharacterized protein [Setaria viridis]|uniref:F-box protein At3g26010-like beta-propeller domain-containing protein n=1 Tax=Setaria viridis TaxID=4556 RepID=A0A4U6VME7_SETVI|nr:uncharacterized protein LOC117844003 [Setaria viridis]TKW30901.1 hypothetical protein SEVIR_2G068700v2 [Setaria viridis]
MADDRQLPNDALVEVAPAMKPLRGGSSFAVSTAQREVHGDPLHRTELPPTLKGFFFCGRNDVDGDGNYDGEETEEDDAPLPYLLPPKKYGQFADLLANSAAPLVDLDPSFSFITKALPGIDHIYLLDSCNGLLLFGHLEDAHNTPETCYVVCNPATEQWVAVPSCGRIDPTRRRSSSIMHTYLLFDPAMSSHFNVVLFWENPLMTTVHAYSSETGAWSGEGQEIGPLELWRYRNAHDRFHIHGRCPGAMVDGMLYLIYDRYWILQVDAQGKTQRQITAPGVPQEVDYFSNGVVFIGQSQGRLHCIMEEGDDDVLVQFSLQLNGVAPYEVHSWKSNLGISIWVLQDLDTQEWVLKGRVSYLELFGKRNREGNVDYRVAAMHPDCNLLFFVQHWDCKMVSYDIDSQEVRALDTDFYHDYEITPYVPYVSELFLGVIGGHKLAH